MNPHWAFAAIGATLQVYVVLAVVKTGYVLPGNMTPPENWPMTARSREIYKPLDGLRESMTYFTR